MMRIASFAYGALSTEDEAQKTWTYRLAGHLSRERSIPLIRGSAADGPDRSTGSAGGNEHGKNRIPGTRGDGHPFVAGAGDVLAGCRAVVLVSNLFSHLRRVLLDVKSSNRAAHRPRRSRHGLDSLP